VHPHDHGFRAYVERKAPRGCSAARADDGGLVGLFQPVADVLKLLQKRTSSRAADRVLFGLARCSRPIALATAAVILPARRSRRTDVGVIRARGRRDGRRAVFMAGWASTQVRAAGGMRGVAQAIT
jgi:NADH:ubiquinone oxidoreductase subunit H